MPTRDREGERQVPATHEPAPRRLAGKTAIVTGAGSGIGRATAERFAQEGAAVVCAGLSAEDNAATARAIADRGGAAFPIEADVTRDDDVAALVGGAIEALGHVDVLINNAGQAVIGTAEDVARADWDRQLDVNVTSIYRTAKAIWGHMRARGGGAILNTASIAGLIGTPGQVAYGTSKGAVTLTKCLALDGAGDRIRVNCICPGWVRTPMVDYHLSQLDDPEGFAARLERLHPLGVGDPASVAGGFVYLASDEAAWITGIALPIDGGVSCGLVPE